MKEHIQRPDSISNTFDSQLKNHNQASASEILQTYKNRISLSDPIQQKKSHITSENINNGSNVHQFNLAQHNEILRNNFYDSLGTAGLNFDIDGLNIDTNIDEIATHMNDWDVIQNINPAAGNHIYNSIGNSIWTFYNNVYENIRGDTTYNAIKSAINTFDINNIFYNYLGSLCEEFQIQRDTHILRFWGAVNSKNHITYALYVSKYFYDWQVCVQKAMYGDDIGDMPNFDRQQAIDQPALTAQESHVKDTSDADTFYTAFNDCNTLFYNTIDVFEEAMGFLCNYIENYSREYRNM